MDPVPPLEDPPRRPAARGPVAGPSRAALGRHARTRTTGYAGFVEAVARAQVAEWLPADPGVLLDLTGDGRHARDAQQHGWRALAWRAAATRRPPAAPGVPTVTGDPADLAWLAPESVAAVVAEGRTLSRALLTERCLEGLVRVLVPGGRVLLAVDSLLAGMSRLADQQRWAELSDVPAADVVIVPDSQGRLARCFWPEELRAVLEEAGLEVEWVRPRTVLSAEAVERTLADDAGRMRELVGTELALAARREGDAHGERLVASARRPG